MDFSFLRANRFWALVILAVLGVLEGMGLVDPSVTDPLKVLLTGFVIVRTADRASERLAGK